MINEEYGKFNLVCDICYASEDERHDNETGVINTLKELGYVKKKESDKWIHICPECQEW